MPILQLLLIIPIIGSLLTMLVPETTLENKTKIKNIAITTAMINFFISIILLVLFDSSTSEYQFVSEFAQLSFCHLYIGVDGISIYFVLLTTFITPIALLSNYNNIDSNKSIKIFVISFLLLETLQLAVFMVLDLFLFYIFFESVLPILFIIILVYGSGQYKERSALLFFLYTLAGSLFMLLAVIQIYSHLGSTDYNLISLTEISLESQKILWLTTPLQQGSNMTSRIIIKNNNTLNLLERFPRSNKNYLPSNNKCKDLVVYGSNLASTTNYPRYTTIVRHMVQIPSNLESIILGILLSDGHLWINKAGNTLLSFKQSLGHIEFFLFVYSKFTHFCSSYPRLDKTIINGKRQVGIVFVTRVFPCLTEWYNMFYINKIKIITLDLYNLLTYEALAYWIMGDGTRSGGGLTLQTQSFTIKECVFIVSILIHKFNLKCSIHMQRNQPTIYISANSVKQLRAKLLPYFAPSMVYKLGL
jgi:hypothetical protein